MLSWTSFCQDTITRPVKISTLKKIKKDLDKCDSLRVAYDNQVSAFNILIKSNTEFLQQIQEDQKKRDILQKQLDDSVKALRKKKNNWLLPTGIGLGVGIVGGFIIAN